MSVCTFYLKPASNPANLEDIKKRIKDGSLQEKIVAVKDLIKCIVNDQSFPPIIMNIITNIIPVQHKSNQLRKVMMLYWEIVEKSKSATDKSLKEEVFLACNSLRNDLIGHNEYVRGRTLRLVSRIMHKGVIQPLATAITKNLTHKSAYVRRNAVICLFNVFIHFGSDVIGDVDEDIQELLQTQTDLSTKRNAFLLLNKSAAQKAMNYLQGQIKNQAVQQIGDILQLAILKILKSRCREDPSQRAKLLRIVTDFQEKGTDAVKLQCALTATAISNSATTIRGSLSIYVGILARTSEINVKKIILDKLELICKNSNYLQDDQLEDLLEGLNTPSAEVKGKIIDIVISGVSNKSAQMVLKRLLAEDLTGQHAQLVPKIMTLLQIITHKCFLAHPSLLSFLQTKALSLQQLDSQSVLALSNVFRVIYTRATDQTQQALTKLVINTLNQLTSPQILTIVLDQLSAHLKKQQEIQQCLQQLKQTVGAAPLEAKQQESQQSSKPTINLRHHLITDSIMGGVFVRSVAKLLYKIRKTAAFTRGASSMLVIFCGLLRNYQNNLSFVDQAVVDQITVVVRRLLDPAKFISTNDPLFQSRPSQSVEFTFGQKRQEVIEKNPSDLIHFRLLRKQEVGQLDFDEQQVNDILEQAPQKIDYIGRLRSIVQLTGSFDPLYAQAFVKVSKYDLFFDILLLNTTKHNFLNVQIEFTSSAEVLVLQKAQCVNLRAFEWVSLRAQLRFSAGQFGVVYGYINYDNQAGLEQPYLITQEINIDYMQFVEPAEITQTNFKLDWEKSSNELVFQTTIPLRQGRSFRKIIQIYEKILHARLVSQVADNQQQYFLNCHLFGKSKLGESFLINVALFAGQQINLSATIRSKDKAVSDIIHKELVKRKFTDAQQQQEEE